MTTLYTKPAQSLPELYAEMIGRGLQVGNPASLETALENLGYYRLGGYVYPFLVPPDRNVFKSGTTWEQIARVYEFDRELRLLVSDAVERIEVGLRARLVSASTVCLLPVGPAAAGATYTHIAPAGPHWFMGSRNFHSKFNHGMFLKKVEREVGVRYDSVSGQRIMPLKHAEQFIEHYYTKYGDPYLPPFWMVAEVLTLGSLSSLYSGLGRPTLKARIARPFDITAKVMGSWLHSLAHLRNICAHHGRLWNRTFSIIPKIPSRLAATVNASNRFEGHATVLIEMLRVTAPSDDWKAELRALLARFPEIDPTAMGFGPSWSTPYWES